MPKFRVTINYQIQMTEIYEVDFDTSSPEGVEDLAGFLDENECPSEYCFGNSEMLKEKLEGDCVEGSWNTHVEEINVLDQIVESLEAKGR